MYTFTEVIRLTFVYKVVTLTFVFTISDSLHFCVIFKVQTLASTQLKCWMWSPLDIILMFYSLMKNTNMWLFYYSWIKILMKIYGLEYSTPFIMHWFVLWPKTIYFIKVHEAMNCYSSIVHLRKFYAWDFLNTVRYV